LKTGLLQAVGSDKKRKNELKTIDFRIFVLVKQILSISMAAMLLFGSMGFSWATHYCGGHAVEAKLVLGHSDIGCGMEQKQKDCDSGTKKVQFEKQTCCQDDFVQIGVESEYKVVSTSEVAHNTDYIATYILSIAIQYEDASLQTPKYLRYSPPLLIQDIPVMMQSFLI
jgi:hypothetical protein